MIEFQEVSYSYPNGYEALRNINLRIEKGELVAIAGENGSGKTTLARHVNGLLKPSKGRVMVFGLDTRKASVAQLARRVGIVFQNPDHQLFSETCEEEVAFAPRNFGLHEGDLEERSKWVLRFLNLESYAKTPPMLLSSGEKKRLCLASILAWDPDVLILDEPTVGQDYSEKQKLHHFMRTITTTKTVITVSHDVEFLWPLQPRIIAMKKGTIIADGPCHEIFCRKEILKECGLVEPQLVSLFNGFNERPSRPFLSVEDAKSWILGRRWKS